MNTENNNTKKKAMAGYPKTHEQSLRDQKINEYNKFRKLTIK